MLHIKHHQYTHRHKKQCNSKKRIYLTYDFINRQQSGKNIIDKYYYYPERNIQRFRCQFCQQSGRAGHKDSSYQYHQKNCKTAHHLLGSYSQIATDDLRQAFTAITQREHTCQVIMYGSGKDTAEHNPQIR